MRLRRKDSPPTPPASRPRRGPRAVLSALMLAALPVASTPALAAAVPLPALTFAPHSAAAHLHSGEVSSVEYATSTNWAGYAAHSTTYTSVTATWREPGASCGSSASYAAFWTGLDGYASASVEQTGTLVECSGGSAHQLAWYEMYPANPVYFSNTPGAGDSMTATVSATSAGAFTLTLSDSTQGWSHTIHQTNSSLARSSAEVIAEAPSSSTGVLPLANYGTVSFTGARVNSGTLGASNPTEINMVSGSTTKTSCSAITGGTAFSCTWHHS
jgi:peptidase A4-like protein